MRKSLRRIPDMHIVLIVDADMARAFCDYFEPRYAYNRSGKFYAIDAVANGQEALALYPPGSTIVVGENLPDMTRHEFLLKLSNTLGPEWVSRINFIFVNEESTAHEPTPTFVERYWEIGKPLDFVSLEKMLKRMRIHGIWANPTTHLPSGRAIENELKELISRQNWALLLIATTGIDAFADQYGWVASDGVIRFTADLIEEVVDEYSAPTDFVGHIGADDFVTIISQPEKAEIIARQLQTRFDSGVQQCYPAGTAVPPLKLAIGILRASDGPFADIKEITERSAAARQRTSDINSKGAATH